MRANTETATKAFIGLFDKTEGTKNVTRYPAEQDREIIFSHLRFAEKLFPKNGLGLCPVSHATTQYYSRSCEQILGHLHKDLMKATLPEFFAFFHPEDLPSVQQCFRFIGSFNTADPEIHRFAIQFRFRNKQNEYQHIRCEQLAVKIRDNSYLYLMMYSNISQEEKFYHVKMDIYKMVNGNYLKMDTYNPQQQEKNITPRQNDIAKLIIKGFTNQEIANQLGVSIYTVKNHKQMLFRRVNVKNSIELANYVMQTSL